MFDRMSGFMSGVVEKVSDRFRQWKIAVFLIAVVLSGLAQFGWQVLVLKEDE